MRIIGKDMTSLQMDKETQKTPGAKEASNMIKKEWKNNLTSSIISRQNSSDKNKKTFNRGMKIIRIIKAKNLSGR